MESRTIASVAIIGGGVAGWMSAAYLSNILGKSVTITLLNLGGDPLDIFHGASIPPLKAFHNSLGLNEADVIANCQGTMKLGTQFVNWGTLGNRYFHPHGAYGADFDVVPLHQWWLKARMGNEDTPSLDDHSIAWALAQEARFALPSPDRRLIQSTYDYAHHLDAGQYARYLADYAKARGVIEISSTIAQIDHDATTGNVTSLKLENGQALKGDLFLNCSKGQSLNNDVEQGAGFVDWTSYLPCDRAVSVVCESGGEFSPYTRVTARDAGWQWRIPLQDRTSMGYVFASSLLSDDAATAALMDNLDGRAQGEPIITPFVNGRRAKAFEGNVVSIGGGAGFLEPLEATGLHFVYSGLTRLLALWPRLPVDPIIAREYNDLTAAEWDLARDLLILHYKANSRTDSSLWRDCQQMEIPDSLQIRLDHWMSSARLVSPRPELFQSQSWLSVLVGQNIMPNAYDPLADVREDQVDYQSRLAGIRRVIEETVPQMPLHRAWLDKNARSLKT